MFSSFKNKDRILKLLVNDLSPPSEFTLNLLKTMGTDLDARDLYGETALIKAVRYSKGKKNKWYQVVQWLLKNGASVNEYALTSRGGDNNSAMHCAVTFPHTKTAELLLEFKADLNAFNAIGETPYSYAIDHGSPAMKELIQRSHVTKRSDEENEDSEPEEDVDDEEKSNQKKPVDVSKEEKRLEEAHEKRPLDELSSLQTIDFFYQCYKKSDLGSFITFTDYFCAANPNLKREISASDRQLVNIYIDALFKDSNYKNPLLCFYFARLAVQNQSYEKALYFYTQLDSILTDYPKNFVDELHDNFLIAEKENLQACIAEDLLLINKQLSGESDHSNKDVEEKPLPEQESKRAPSAPQTSDYLSACCQNKDFANLIVFTKLFQERSGIKFHKADPATMELADHYIKKIHESDPSHISFFYLAMSYLSKKNHELSLHYFNQLLQHLLRHPQHPDARSFFDSLKQHHLLEEKESGYTKVIESLELLQDSLKKEKTEEMNTLIANFKNLDYLLNINFTKMHFDESVSPSKKGSILKFKL